MGEAGKMFIWNAIFSSVEVDEVHTPTEVLGDEKRGLIILFRPVDLVQV